MMSKPGLFVGVILVWTATLLAVIPAAAQQPMPSDDQVNALARQMYCPVCENTTLDDCPTQACVQWRDLIKQKMQLGWSDQQIKEYFVAQYGDRVLALPPARGFNWLIYILPPLLIAFAAFILYRIIRRMKKQTAPVNPVVTDVQDMPLDPYINRMEEEFIRYEKF